MNLSAPTSLSDVISDGWLLAAAVDAAWPPAHTINHTAFDFSAADWSADNDNVLAPDCPVAVAVNTQDGTGTLPGRRIASITGGQWIWTTTATAGLNVSELQETTAYTPELLQAARTLVGGNKLLLAPAADTIADPHSAQVQTTFVIAVDWDHPIVSSLPHYRPSTAVTLQEALLNAVQSNQLAVDERRAVESFACFRGLGWSYASTPYELGDAHLTLTTGDSFIFAAGTIVDFQPITPKTTQPAPVVLGPQTSASVTHSPRPRSVADVIADAHHLAVEYAWFFDHSFPKRAMPTWNSATGRVTLGDSASTEIPALIVATVREGIFTWAWADPFLNRLPFQKEVLRLRQFGLTHGIFPLVRPCVKADIAKQLRLLVAAMPVVRKWVQVTTRLDENTLGLALLSTDFLPLPPLSGEVERAVIAATPPPFVDVHRAQNAYRNLRCTKAD
ncbi:MAG: hypothetical protein SOW59_01570 [Corynebacterium sp.]|nr:hypothetical protein [Corynebacterium sp.]